MADFILSDLQLVHRPALASATPLLGRRIRLTPLPEGPVLQVFGDASHSAPLAKAAERAGVSVHANGPGQWFLVGDEPLPANALSDLARSLPSGFSVVDQSHGRVRIAVEGEAVEAVLAKGTGIDLSRFAIGHATTTLVGHVATHISRTAIDRFELMPLRGFAESLWHDLGKMAAEFAAG